MGITGRAPRFVGAGVACRKSIAYPRCVNYIKSAYVWIACYMLVGWVLFSRPPWPAAALLFWPFIFGLLAWGLSVLLRKLRIE